MRITDFKQGKKGEFRFVLKQANGFGISVASPAMNATFNTHLELTLSMGKKGVVQTVEFKAEDGEYSSISASYTAGGMTLTATMMDAENMNGTTTATQDRERWALSASFAF